MNSTIEDTLRHVQFLNRHLNTSDVQCMAIVALLELGISTKKIGFDYIKKGVLLLIDDPVQLITKGLYPEIGRQYDPPVNKNQVERAIRSAIYEAWFLRDEQVWNCYFPGSMEFDSKIPTNAEFLTRIARILELWQGCRKEVAYEKE